MKIIKRTFFGLSLSFCILGIAAEDSVPLVQEPKAPVVKSRAKPADIKIMKINCWTTDPRCEGSYTFENKNKSAASFTIWWSNGTKPSKFTLTPGTKATYHVRHNDQYSWVLGEVPPNDSDHRFNMYVTDR